MLNITLPFGETQSVFRSTIHGNYEAENIPKHSKMSMSSKLYHLVQYFSDHHEEMSDQLLEELSKVRPHSQQDKIRVEILKKLQKINYEEVLEEIVGSAFDVAIMARGMVHIQDEIDGRSNMAPQTRMTSGVNEADFDILAVPTRDRLEEIRDCLNSYTETDFEQSLKWVQCVFQCR